MCRMIIYAVLILVALSEPGQTAQDTGGSKKLRRIEWEKIKVDAGAYESAGVFDVNNDGKLDIVCGAYWYEAPKWTKHKVGDVMAVDEYYDDFSTIPMDVNGDGYTDFITGGWWGCKLVWKENPRGQSVEWPVHKIDDTTNIETTRAWDVDGDGELEIVPNCPGSGIAYYKLINKNGKGTGEWKKVQISTEPQGHGLGFGEIVPGKKGFVVHNGWWESPSDPTGKWIFHQEFELGSASVPILVVDINHDGRNELVVGQAHGYGLDYYTWDVKPTGRIWKKHPIDPWFSQYHEMHWVDIDGDGECELVTGNRFRAHCGKEPGETDVVGLYYFKWNGESLTKCVIDHGKKGEASGTGIFMWIGDLFGSGRMDIVAPGKEGLYIFRNLGSETVGDNK